MANDNLVTVDQLEELARRSDERFIDKDELASVQQEIEQVIDKKVSVEVDATQNILIFTMQ